MKLPVTFIFLTAFTCCCDALARCVYKATRVLIDSRHLFWCYNVIGYLYHFSIRLFKDESIIIPALSGGQRRAVLEWKYGMKGVSDDPEPLVNYLDVRTVL